MNIQIRNASDVSAAKTADLIAFYNAHLAGDQKPVNKFTNRETAERRVLQVVLSLEASAKVHEAAKKAQAAAKAAKEAEKARDKEQTSQHADEPRAIREPVKPVKVNKAGEVKTAPEPTEAQKKEIARRADAAKTAEASERAVTLTGRRSNAEAIAASWNDSTIREERLNRQGVIVAFGGNASQFNSTRAAFRELGLPDSKHIRFRMKLKAEGTLEFTHDGKTFTFTIID